MRLALAGAIALTGASCVLGDVFGSDGLEQATLHIDAPPGNLKPNERASFCVTVRVGDAPLRNARVSVRLSDTTVVTFTPRKDSLIALREGTVDLTARLETAMLVDIELTDTKQIKVVGTTPCVPTQGQPCVSGPACASALPL